ncbi:MAG: hypothetical protein WBX00_33080 [Isosphaeraceae bacterium]
MNEQRDRAYRGWAKFLNPEVLRSNLITASLFLAAYETLKTSIIDRIRAFFTHDFDENGMIVGEGYRTKVLSLDKSPLRASLLWLKEMSAIDDFDIARIDEIREHRNALAHELPTYIATGDADVNIQLLVAIVTLVTKIDRWWIREVDIPIDPDYDGREVADGDIHSGNMIFLQMMLQIAAGEDSAVYWDEFQKTAGRMFGQGNGRP